MAMEAGFMRSRCHTLLAVIKMENKGDNVQVAIAVGPSGDLENLGFDQTVSIVANARSSNSMHPESAAFNSRNLAGMLHEILQEALPTDFSPGPICAKRP
jgi:hypothetical protein